jgi:ABC-type lipoprotein export system ATPase subunit
MPQPPAPTPQDELPTAADGMIVCDRLVRIYSGEGIEVQALQGLDLLVAEGELTALIGAAGSGKSTLMNILAGLDAPTAGAVWVAGHDLGAMTARERLAYRRRVVGFIWQQTSRNLLPYMTARQNVLLPMRLGLLRRRERRRRADFLLGTLGIAHCADRTPDRMSGGEQQRAAIATALANEPRVLLADEPTGELDSATAQDVFAAIQTANTELGVTVLVVTHDPAVSSQVRRTIAIRDGKTSSETIRHAATDEQGRTTLHAREYATLDRAGRVQLPREMIRHLGMRKRVELQEEADHIGVWPDNADSPAPESDLSGRLSAAAGVGDAAHPPAAVLEKPRR